MVKDFNVTVKEFLTVPVPINDKYRHREMDEIYPQNILAEFSLY
jgi:hypothetical protein